MNLFAYAFNVEEVFFKKPLREFGYKAFTTFYSDLTLGECAEGIDGVKDTINRVTKSWINDYKYFTEFIMAVNYKSFEMNYRLDNELQAPHNSASEYLQLYCEEYYRLRDLFYDHYKDNQEAKDYFYRTTD